MKVDPLLVSRPSTRVDLQRGVINAPAAYPLFSGRPVRNLIASGCEGLLMVFRPLRLSVRAGHFEYESVVGVCKTVCGVSTDVRPSSLSSADVRFALAASDSQ